MQLLSLMFIQVTDYGAHEVSANGGTNGGCGTWVLFQQEELVSWARQTSHLAGDITGISSDT